MKYNKINKKRKYTIQIYINLEQHFFQQYKGKKLIFKFFYKNQIINYSLNKNLKNK